VKNAAMNRNFGSVGGLSFNGLDVGVMTGAGGPWFGDWSAYTPVYNISGTTVSVPQNSWFVIVNITGKGFFKWCRAYDTTNDGATPKIRLTIDGAQKVFDSIAIPSGVGNEVKNEIPFLNSLKIEIFNSMATTASMVCDYLYFLQNTNPNPNINTILQQSVVKNAFLSTPASSLTDVLNLTGSGYLLSAKFFGRFSSTPGGDIFGDITIDGTNVMNNRLLWRIESNPYKLGEIVGPIRFNTSLRVRTRTSQSWAWCLVEYSLD